MLTSNGEQIPNSGASRPILVNNSKPKSQSLKAVKCKCRKSWCPACSKTTVIKPLVDQISQWDYRRVRQITLTLDPGQFEGPEQAYDHIQDKKAISSLFRNLERTMGIAISDWVRVVEWHKNGFPHWHLLVLVEKTGREGQLGGDNLRHYWPFGRVHEHYIRDENHWKRFKGYFAKHGYFEDKKGKKHQVELPQWARDRRTTIRRIGRKKCSGSGDSEPGLRHLREKKTWEEKTMDERVDELGEWFEKMANTQALTEGEKLDLCGSRTEIWRGPDFSDFIGVCPVPYKKFIQEVHGQFVQGQGYVFDVGDFDAFIRSYGIQ